MHPPLHSRRAHPLRVLPKPGLSAPTASPAFHTSNVCPAGEHRTQALPLPSSAPSPGAGALRPRWHRRPGVTGPGRCCPAGSASAAVGEWMCRAELIPAEQYNAVPSGALLIADEHIPFPVKHIHSRKKCIDHLLKHIYYSEMCTSTNERHRSYSKMIMLTPSRLNHLFIFNQLILVRRLSMALPLLGISSPNPIFFFESVFIFPSYKPRFPSQAH